MTFPLKELVEFKDNIYEITRAASRRAEQLSTLGEDCLDESLKGEKYVSIAAKQLFQDTVKYEIEKDN